MSRLDALTARFEGNSDRARAFARAVRAQFQAAPSYAQILRALKEVPGKNPAPEHVAAIIKRDLAAGSRAADSPGERPSRRARPAADGAEGPATGGRRYARRPAGAGRPSIHGPAGSKRGGGPGRRPGGSDRSDRGSRGSDRQSGGNREG